MPNHTKLIIGIRTRINLEQGRRIAMFFLSVSAYCPSWQWNALLPSNSTLLNSFKRIVSKTEYSSSLSATSSSILYVLIILSKDKWVISLWKKYLLARSLTWSTLRALHNNNWGGHSESLLKKKIIFQICDE